MDLSDLRKQYTQHGLLEHEANRDAIEQFGAWFQAAVESNTGDWYEPNVMTLATATPDGAPSARIVLLKQFDERGFVFYTNSGSEKGAQIAANSRVAMVLHWPQLERQVRIEGDASIIDRADTQRYWERRPRGSRLGAVASRQSTQVPSRDALEAELEHFEKLYEGHDIPLPDDWNGYRVAPHTIEFWQGRTNRLHDRLVYTKEADGSWKMTRLAP